MVREKIKCSECEYCSEYQKLGNKRSEFSCKHPNQKYILDYFREKKILKMPGFLGFSNPYKSDVPIKTSPAWCPKRKVLMFKG